MNFALVSMNDRVYQPLADITWVQNKVEYATRYGYGYACKIEGWYGIDLAWEKICFIRDMMIAYPEIDWFWWTGCDTLITNMTIKLDDVVDNDYHVMIAADCNGLNSDSLFFRNSPEGRAYIDMIVSKHDEYVRTNWKEQQVIIDTLPEYSSIIKVVPQKLINAYDYGLYPECTPIDQNGNDGQWAPGDLLIHWPGTALGRRIQLAQHYLTQVVR